MIDSLFASHPVGKSPRGAYLTWGVAEIAMMVFLIGRLFS